MMNTKTTTDVQTRTQKAVAAGAGDYDIGTAYAVYVAGTLLVDVAINGAVG